MSSMDIMHTAIILALIIAIVIITINYVNK